MEVSKYTEGSKDTVVRPNGLPESLIKYDGTTSSYLMLHKCLPYLHPQKVPLKLK